MLHRFGFGERFIDMIWRLLSNVWFSVIVNGESFDFLKFSRGFWEGDPLSLALFMIGEEVLSRGLNLLASQSDFWDLKALEIIPLFPTWRLRMMLQFSLMVPLRL